MRRAHLHRAAGSGRPAAEIFFFLTQSKASAAEKRTRAATRLPLYLFKCTSDKSSIQSGQGLPRLTALYTTRLSTLVYSHLPTPRCHCGLGAACCLLPAPQPPAGRSLSRAASPCARLEASACTGNREGRGTGDGPLRLRCQFSKSKAEPSSTN